MAFWDDWQKNKNSITWSEGFQHGYKKIPKSSTPSSEELSLAKANKKLVGKEKLNESMQNTVQKVVKNMVKEGITSGRFDKNKPRDLLKFNQKFIDKTSNKTSLSNVISNAIGNRKDIKSPETFNNNIARFVKSLTGKDIDPTKDGSFNEFVQAMEKPTKASNVTNTSTSNKNETAIKKAIQSRTISGESVDSSLRRLNQKYTKNFARSWMKNSYNNNGNLKGISETVPRSSNTLSPRQLGSLVRGGINGVMANAGNMSTMPLPDGYRDRLRIENHPEDLSSVDTTVPINSQGTQYLDPKLGVVDTQVLEDEDGIRYYRNAQTGQFDPLDSGAPFRYSSIPVEQTPFPKFRTFNIGDDTDYSTDSDVNKLLPPMSADEGEIPSGTVVVGPDTEVPAQPVQSVQSAQSVNKPNVASVVKPPRRAPKPKPYVEPAVINNTPVATTSNVPTSNVAAPILSSVVPQAVRHNGGFDNYRRESVLSALRAAGGISPAEAVQRGIIPWEALNYV